MSTTSKAFAYIFNTPSEDCKVAKVLSGWRTDERVKLASLNCFDSQAQQRVRRVMARLFFACFQLHSIQQTVNTSVLEKLMAYVLRHFPQLRQLNDSSFIVRRLEESTNVVGVSTAELLAWSSVLLNAADVPDVSNAHLSSTSDIADQHPFLKQQAP